VQAQGKTTEVAGSLAGQQNLGEDPLKDPQAQEKEADLSTSELGRRKEGQSSATKDFTPLKRSKTVGGKSGSPEFRVSGSTSKTLTKGRIDLTSPEGLKTPGTAKKGVKRTRENPVEGGSENTQNKTKTSKGARNKSGVGAQSTSNSASKATKTRENPADKGNKQDSSLLATPGPGSGQRKRGRPSKKDLAERLEQAERLEREAAGQCEQEVSEGPRAEETAAQVETEAVEGTQVSESLNKITEGLPPAVEGPPKVVNSSL
jgi:hypothetical protein